MYLLVWLRFCYPLSFYVTTLIATAFQNIYISDYNINHFNVVLNTNTATTNILRAITSFDTFNRFFNITLNGNTRITNSACYECFTGGTNFVRIFMKKS